ncbi:hypothetical protein [Actinomyces sp. 2119]|uniref:hypothetical protein n=1 Tax=Actinomyces sp. 2119 TaxID=2321393 RepID=UPI001C7215D6|nr:hypothetical protein [Actinomyces sp. 2119]
MTTRSVTPVPGDGRGGSTTGRTTSGGGDREPASGLGLLQVSPHRRSFLAAGVGLGLIAGVAACQGSTGAPGRSAAPVLSAPATADGTTGTTSAGAPSATGPEYHEPAADNTALSAGSWSGTVGDRTVDLAGAYVVDGTQATIDGGTWESTEPDQAVFLVVNGGSLTLTNAAVTKSGDATSSNDRGVDDAYSFYGLNSAVVVVGEDSSATVAETTIKTTSSGSNAVVATDSAQVSVTACAITTTGESARGLHATYQGTITGSDLTIDTTGAHCAAVATDRGNGTVTVEGTNTFTTAGDGSPLIYSTGAITVSGLTGQATGAQAVVVEGRNQATVSGSTLTTGSTRAGVMLYQSMSGDAADADAATEVSALEMSDVELTCTQDVPVLYVTNTTAEATLTSCTLSTPGGLATAEEDRWGQSGSNGGTLTLTLDDTVSDGALTAGDTSSITVTVTNGGQATGTTSGEVSVG